MDTITPITGAVLLALFGIVMVIAVWFLTRHGHDSVTGFLVADREVGPIKGALSTAITFIWAPAVFVCSLKSFTDGVPGIFWFMAPNIACFFIFAVVASHVRRIHPNGFTITQLCYERLQSRPAHIALLVIFFLWMVTAIVINGVAGGAMLAAVTGMNFQLALLGLSLIALAYSLISGMRASILTDVLQMTMVLGIAFILVPWVMFAGGFESVKEGIGGLANLTNPLDPKISYEFGILASIGLIGGTLQDQMFYQRAYSVRQRDITKMFILGGLIFAVVPISLSLLGFAGAGLVQSGQLTVANPEMVGPAVISHFLPKFAMILFILMAFCGLASTLDSAFCAISSLVSVDLYKIHFNQNANDSQMIRAARIGMLVFGAIGIGIALLKPNILWVFRTYAAVAVGGIAPVLFLIYGKKPHPNGIIAGVVVGLVVAIPSSVYGNIVENPNIIIWGTIAGLVFSTLVCTFSLQSDDQSTTASENSAVQNSFDE